MNKYTLKVLLIFFITFINASEFYGAGSFKNIGSSSRVIALGNTMFSGIVSSENMLIKVLQRAKELINIKKEIYSTSSLALFLNNNYTLADFDTKPQLLNAFAELDDFDIYSCLKSWKNNPDFVLSSLSDMILNRIL